MKLSSDGVSARIQGCRFLIIAAVNGFLAVAGGAFAAHGLQRVMTPAGMATLETALNYQTTQGLALLGAGLWAHLGGGIWVVRSCKAFVLGICLFSGSLYLLLATGWKLFAWLTPVGGVTLLSAWIFLLLAASSQYRALRTE